MSSKCLSNVIHLHANLIIVYPEASL
uniref:Uncharacterized protein n=1 Tax=Rhizophora mucronata TaxID=61149 RepID=A0A2P2R1S5_RHIMU